MSKKPRSDKSIVRRSDVEELYNMLEHMRPHMSKTEEGFIKEYLLPLGLQQDAFGNLYKKVGEAPVIWSCHTDTVHHRGGLQHIGMSSSRMIGLLPKSVSNCLGADDTAGVWLMSQMIRADVQGMFIFHRGEEVGCKGSVHFAKNNQDLIKGYKCVIALDRRDNDSVITFQRGNRCCSDDFGKSIAEELNSHMWADNVHLDYKNDPTGAYTDSASYVNIIGECTNLSVGYTDQHGRSEQLDLNHILRLREALIKMDLTKLRYSRIAGTHESRWGTSSSTYYGDDYGYSRGSSGWSSYWCAYADKDGIGVSKMYVEKYMDGYMNRRLNKWIKLTEPEWEEWKKTLTPWDEWAKKCREELEARTKAAEETVAAARTGGGTGTAVVAVTHNGHKVDVKRTLAWADYEEIVKLVRTNAEEIAAALITWGYDEDLLQEVIIEHTYTAGEERATIQDNKVT